MDAEGYTNGIRQYFPKLRMLQNVVPFQSTADLSTYGAGKIRTFTCKQNDTSELNNNKNTNKWSSLLQVVVLILDSISACTAYVHFLIFRSFISYKSRNDSVHEENQCSICNPNDYYHALKHDYRKVPKVSVEPYIYKGYVLPFMPWRYYWRVMWFPNNETLNVWTHLVPSLCFMYMLWNFSQNLDLIEMWPLFFITLGAVFLTMCSSLAHTFHSRSTYHHSCWYMFDYFGILCFALFSMTSHYFASAELSYYNKIGSFNLWVIFLITLFGFVCCSISQTGGIWVSVSCAKQWKLWFNVFGYCYGMLPICHRLYTSWPNIDLATLYYGLQLLFNATSILFFASRFPERCWPGKLDIVGHSHQLFHIFGSMGVYFDICAVYTDVTSERWAVLKSQPNYPGFFTIFTLFVINCVYSLIVSAFLSSRVRKEHIGELNNLQTCPSAAVSVLKSGGNREKKKH